MASYASSSSSTQGRTSSVSSSRGGAAIPASHLESVITRLLVATKQLLEGLAKWSRREITEDEISSIYVKLGNDFNVACAAFDRENIGMKELLSVPSDLRVCLETCLSDTPSQATLERHLPKVRQIIIGLLTGLREKQKLYREGVATRRAGELKETDARRAREGGSVPGTSSGRTNGGPVDAGSTSDRPGTGGSSPTIVETPMTPTGSGRSRDQLRKFVTQTQAVATQSQSLPSTRSATPASAVPNYALSPVPSSPPVPSTSQTAPHLTSPNSTRIPPSPAASPTKPRIDRSVSVDESGFSSPSSRSLSRSSNSLRDSGTSSRSTDADSFASLPSMSSSGSLASTLGNFSPRRTGTLTKTGRSSPPPPKREAEDPGPVPRTPTDFSSAMFLSSQQNIPVIVRPPSTQHSAYEDPFSASFTANNQTPAQLQSLEALKSSDNLSRRASKRFSAYAIQKITTGGTSPARIGEGMVQSRSGSDMRDTLGASAGRELLQAQSGGNGDEKRMSSAMRRGKSDGRSSTRTTDLARSMPPIPSSLSYERDLRASTSTIREESPTPPRGSHLTPEASSSQFIMTPSPIFDRPSLISSPLSSPTPTSPTPRSNRVQSSEDSAIEPEYPISIYLQIGKDVKKTQLEQIPDIAALRVLFIERFAYNPGLMDFPNVYLRDPIVGIQYELEDMSEVKNGSVISLNIDNVEQVKQHIDQGLLNVAHDIKELRSMVVAMRRASIPALSLGPSPSSPLLSPTSNLPSPNLLSPTLGPPILSPLPASADSKRSLTSTVPSPKSSRASNNTDISALKLHHKEVQDLRREVGVLRQVYGDFTESTKIMFSTLRAQTSQVQSLAATKVSSSRAFIDAGKSKLESETSDLVMKVDDLQDAVEEMRSDISNRKIRPRPAQIEETTATLKAAHAARNELVSWISTVKPSWKATWSEELETIIHEERLLVDQETILKELDLDLEELATVFGNIKQVAAGSKGPSRPSRDFAPSPSTEEHGGLSTVLLEVRNVLPDANKRLEAIAKAEKQRETNLLTGKKDEFADELGGFVLGNRLKKSGGVEETERLRAIKSEQTLRSMFLGEPVPPVPSSSVPFSR